MFLKTLVWSLSVALLVLLLNLVGLRYELYWYLWWYDIVLHFLGGLVLGLAATWFFGTVHHRFGHIRTGLLISLILSFVLFGGIVWEWFEYISGITLISVAWYQLDVLMDVLMDMLGGMCAFWIWKKQISKKYE
ncbi:MAG: hypothetical protein A2664_01730 [Candidatus Taylorbacteria bacterium RIFCSPHIGHO2_01_FULL_46_22b]|uniref:VanZ-like domain-containing protein n=1 Tax=Candidatus Taylorbacteria bacterium RIFCSPHIGHO2_01_FULL_46_22b TaxID=1802301 RepID=A0A1G2M2Q4_9BACT|nr:MAG: hypothetical protein A2664_01730 [Candidatus Taylorbacteria bacterium RIFCSPHIGHO2_01_FULL_46_22b]